MATRKRKPLGNAARFKILQRDGFTCQYCGRTPPSVVLHVDHVVSVAEGGGNEDENLVAACSDCNHGKFTGTLAAETIPRDYAAMATDAKVRTEQLKAYQEHLQRLRAQVNQAIDFVGASFWGGNLTWSYERGTAERSKVERFINLLGLADVEDAARIAFARLPGDGRNESTRRFKYFCGVCWNTATRRGLRGTSDAE